MSSGDFSGLLMPRLVGARRAYREWRVTDVSCGLTSLWNPTYWPTAVHHAVCRVPTGLFTDVKSPPHPVSEAPVYHCTCGVYAYWEPDADSYVSGQVVTGVVEVHGRCVVGTRGVRAQTATVVALAPTTAETAALSTGPVPYRTSKRTPVVWRDLAHALATRYPTVRLYESAEQMWAEWPPQPVRLPTEEADDVVA